MIFYREQYWRFSTPASWCPELLRHAARLAEEPALSSIVEEPMMAEMAVHCAPLHRTAEMSRQYKE